MLTVVPEICPTEGPGEYVIVLLSRATYSTLIFRFLNRSRVSMCLLLTELRGVVALFSIFFLVSVFRVGFEY